MSRVLNPSGFQVAPSAVGRVYEFPPFAIVDIWEEYHADHIVQRSGKLFGLVTLEPNAAEREKYVGKPTEFFKAQALKGLNALLKNLEEALTNEMQAERDVKESKDGGEADKRIINPDRFKAQIKKVQGWIDEVNGDKWSPEKYLKNQKRAEDNEPWDYTAKSAAKAG